MIINSIAVTNNICFLSNIGKKYSYNDNCKNKASISFALTLNEADFPPLSLLNHTHKCKLSPYSNNCNSFSLNEHDFPPLSNVCQPISSNVSESHLHQLKPASIV